MPFPISIRGSFSIPQVDSIDDVRPHLLEQAEILLSINSDDVSADGQTVISRPGIAAWFFSYGNNWHPMVAFDDITLTVSGSASVAEVAYTLSTRRMFWIVLSIATVVAIFTGATSFSQQPLLNTVVNSAKFAALAFFWIFGTNYLLGLLRGPYWLRDQLLKRLQSL